MSTCKILRIGTACIFIGAPAAPALAQNTGGGHANSARSIDYVIDVSPADWDHSTRTFFEDYEAVAFRDVAKPAARGKNGAITATTGATAVYAGLKTLERGGTAADAAVSTALAQVVWAAGSYVSYSGAMNVVYYEAATGKVHNLNAGYNSVLAEQDPTSIPPVASGRTVLVPGFMKGAEALHERFGRLPWSTLFEPAIYYADKGFRVPPLIALYMRGRASTIQRLPEGRTIFAKNDGSPYGEGELFRQPELARTLRAVASVGADYIYTGPWAEHFVEIVRREGGRISMEDMRAYDVIWADPVGVSFGGMEIYGPGPPGRGGTRIAEALNVATEAGLIGLGDYRSSARSFYWLSQLLRLTMIDFTDPALIQTWLPGTDMSLAARAEPEHAERLWDAIQADEFPLLHPPQLPAHSDAIVVVDQWGNVAAVAHSIVTNAWGNSGIFVDGVSINDSAAILRSQLAMIVPGARVFDTMEPLILLENGIAVGALSSIGSSLHPVTLSVLMNLTAGSSELKEAIDAPLLQNFRLVPTGNGRSRVIAQVYEGDFGDELLEEVRSLGAAVEELSGIRDQTSIGGYVVGVSIDPDSGVREAVGSRRLSALPLAY